VGIFTGVGNIFKIVAMMRKSCKPSAVEINRERLIRNAECVDTHIELLATNQKWIADIFLNYIGICLNPPSFFFRRNISKREKRNYLWLLPVGCQDHNDMCFSRNQFLWYSWRGRYLFPTLFQSAEQKENQSIWFAKSSSLAYSHR